MPEEDEHGRAGRDPARCRARATGYEGGHRESECEERAELEREFPRRVDVRRVEDECPSGHKRRQRERESQQPAEEERRRRAGDGLRRRVVVEERRSDAERECR
jgi:hypothetical protein